MFITDHSSSSSCQLSFCKPQFISEIRFFNMFITRNRNSMVGTKFLPFSLECFPVLMIQNSKSPVPDKGRPWAYWRLVLPNEPPFYFPLTWSGSLSRAAQMSAMPVYSPEVTLTVKSKFSPSKDPTPENQKHRSKQEIETESRRMSDFLVEHIDQRQWCARKRLELPL